MQAAERARVERFVFFSAQSASAHHRTRFMRAKAVAERAVGESGVPHTIFAPSLVYAPGDAFLTLLERMALLPVVPISGSGRALFQPIWSHDVADCVMAALRSSNVRRALRAGGPRGPHLRRDRQDRPARLRAPPPLVHVPFAVVGRWLRAPEAFLGSKAFATWDEAELMELTMTAPVGRRTPRRSASRPSPCRPSWAH